MLVLKLSYIYMYIKDSHADHHAACKEIEWGPHKNDDFITIAMLHIAKSIARVRFMHGLHML